MSEYTAQPHSQMNAVVTKSLFDRILECSQSFPFAIIIFNMHNLQGISLYYQVTTV